MRASIIAPFPPDLYSRAWGWLNEFPTSNFDDYGPQTLEEFTQHMDERTERGGIVWLCKFNGRPVGIVGYQPTAPHLGVLAGICFAKEVHGTWATHECFALVLNTIFATGITKLSASYFSDNDSVRGFLQRHGAVAEGRFVRHSLRSGVLVDQDLVAIFG